MPTRSNNQKPRIIAAAFEVVSQQGASHLTIDAVATAAALSKGGVLYHFPNKRALLNGMLQTLIERIGPKDAKRESLVEYIRREESQTDSERAAGLAILASASEDPSLLDPAREMLGALFAQTSANYQDAQLAQILLFATEGMRFMHMLDLLPPNFDNSSATRERLLALANSLETK